MIIGLIGKAGSGKTTVARMMAKELSGIVLSFATPLKKMVEKAGICSHNELFAEKTWFSRKMLQMIGTDLIRNQISEDFWVNAMRDQIKEAREINGGWTPIVIDDVRFKNEFYFIKSDPNGIVVRIEREGVALDSHSSETELDGFPGDHTIYNQSNMTLQDLQDLITLITPKLIGKL